MAKFVLPTPDAWAQLQRDHQRMRSQLQNLRVNRVAPRHLSGAGVRIIRFEMAEELRRGQTKKATHLPWSEEAAIDDLEVTEDHTLSGELRAPTGCRGKAFRAGERWITFDWDCDALEPHDGDPQGVDNEGA